MQSRDTLYLSEKIIEIFRHFMGWCPMAAAAQQETAGSQTGVPPDPVVAGPVAGRTVLYLRLTWGIVGLSYLIALAALPYLPEIIPVHWNLYGEADGFAGRLPGAFGLPILMTFTAVLFTVLPRFERMQKTLDQARDICSIVFFSTIGMLLALQVITLLSAAGMELPIGVLIPMLIGLLFIVIGNLLPHIGRNTTFGIRLPWTLRDETVWRKTHERGGPVFVIAGALIVLGCPVAGLWATPLMLGIIVITVLYITVYSYRLTAGSSFQVMH